MLDHLRPAACFSEQWEALPARLASPDHAMAMLVEASRSRCAVPDHGRDWSPMHRAFWGLVAATPAGIAEAKAAFLQEWRDGAALADPARGGNGIHYWNSLEFRLGHRWICAAMLAQLLIIFDRLAALGAFSDAEIEAIGTEAVGILAAHIAPHQRGRGHQPVLHEPINQAVAMAAGQLWAGHLFGRKWRHWASACELWAMGRQLFADNLGQQPQHGYDGDGFTYMRLILPACHTLSVALLEDVDGGDWYHRAFAPEGTSLALLNHRLLGMVGCSGLSWPLGRYGYIRPWNGFAAAFASRRSGDPAFVAAMLRGNAHHDWCSPWLSLELPLTLLWWPQNDGMAAADPAPREEVVPEAWWSGVVAAGGVHALSTWLRGKAPHMTIEVGGEPVVLGGGESWASANGVQPAGFDWQYAGWGMPGGRLLAAPRLPRLRGAAVDTIGNYPPEAGVAEARRSTLLLDDRRLLLIDRWRAAHPGRWQALVRRDAAVSGQVASNGRNLLLADRPWSQGDGRDVQIDGERTATRQLCLNGGDDDRFAVAICWDSADATPRWEGDTVRLGDDRILPPGIGMRSIADWRTDAAIAVEHADGAWSLGNVRRLEGPDGTVLWCSDPVDVAIDADGLRVHRLPYGGFASLRSPDRWLCLRRGNGLIAWARCPRRQTLTWDGDAPAGVMLNGTPVTAMDGVLHIPAWQLPTDAPDDLDRGGHAARISALARIRRRQDTRAVPALRRLLAADPPEPHLDGRPRLSEATHLRAEAAATCAALGAHDVRRDIMDLLRREAEHDYDPPGTAWSRGFWGSTARAVALDALALFDAHEILPLLPTLRNREVVPHVQEAIARTMRLLSRSAS